MALRRADRQRRGSGTDPFHIEWTLSALAECPFQKSIFVVGRKSYTYRTLRVGSTLRTHPPEITSLGIVQALSRLPDRSRLRRGATTIQYGKHGTSGVFKTAPGSSKCSQGGGPEIRFIVVGQERLSRRRPQDYGNHNHVSACVKL
jgi:hypothetical protein